MAGSKRPRENGDAAIESSQPPAKRRIEYSEAAAELARIYDGLANEVEAVRAKSAEELIRVLWKKSPDRSQRLDVAIKRLIRGLCSGRKAARLGFSVALPEVLRLKFSGPASGDEASGRPDLRVLINEVITSTHPGGNVKGQEKRDHMHGRRFAYQAILQSDVGLSKDLPSEQWQHFVEAIFELGKQKQWVRRDLGAMLYNYLLSPSGSKLSDERVQAILQALVDSKQVRTPEGVGLWVVIADNFPNVTLPKVIWHHQDPLSNKERTLLRATMLENAHDEDGDIKQGGYRHSTPSFAWSVVIDALCKRKDGKDFPKFWEEVVAEGMLSPSDTAERKFLGLQVVALAIGSVPRQQLMQVIHPNILRCIIEQRANKDKVLFEAAKVPLNKMVSRSKEDPDAAAALVEALLTQGLSQIEQLVKLKTIESIVNVAHDSAMISIPVFFHFKLTDCGTDDPAQAETRRRVLGDLILTLVRAHKDEFITSMSAGAPGEPGTQWPKAFLNILTEVAYVTTPHTESISSKSRKMFQSRLMSCLNAILDSGLEKGVWAPVWVVDCLTKYEKKHKTNVPASLEDAKKSLKKATKAKDQAFELLLSLSILQVYNEEPDAVGVLDDAVSCYKAKGKKGDASATLVELLLSFVSKPSALFRKLAEQVFAAVTSQMTAESLQSLLDILEQKESLQGQQELFDKEGEDEEMEEVSEGEEDDDDSSSNEGDDSEDDFENVEDASDLELANGNIVSGSDDSGDDDSLDNSSGEEEGDELAEDEEAAFDRKLAEALRTSGANAPSDDNDDEGSESDMDDEQMMALEPHLASIFSERAKQASNSNSKKQEHKDAKVQIINFKNRVLDLLALYVKAQPGNSLALDLLLPLVRLVKSTTAKATAEKAFAVLKTYFDAANKAKALPVEADAEDVLLPLLRKLHEEMKSGGGGQGEKNASVVGAAGKLPTTACSRASLFVCKVLISKDSKLFETVVDAYADLLKGWFASAGSKGKGGSAASAAVGQAVFTEWMSWSIEVRRSL